MKEGLVIIVFCALAGALLGVGVSMERSRRECPAPAPAEAAPCMEAECAVILRFSQTPMDECLRQLEACQRRTL